MIGFEAPKPGAARARRLAEFLPLVVDDKDAVALITDGERLRRECLGECEIGEAEQRLGEDADAVALGVNAALDRRLKAASKAGYAPAWFIRRPGMGADAGFYPIWVAFHASASPSTSGGGGAAAGGGGAGGGF